MVAAVRPFVQLEAASRSPYAASDLLDDAPEPVLAVDVTGRTVSGEMGAILGALPAVTVAVCEQPDGVGGDGLAAFDILLASGAVEARRPVGTGASWTTPEGGVEAAVRRVVQRARANPQASVAAVQLLRLSSHLDVVDGLAAESFAYSTLQSGPEFRRWIAGRPSPSPTPVDPAPLTVEREGSRLRIGFNRPEVRNAFGFEVRNALVEALQLAAADDHIESIVLYGTGPAFCSGGDLREFGTHPDPASAHLIRTTRSAAYWMHRLADRVTVELHGACIGAGIELAAFAGHVVAANDTSIALPEVGMGLVPGAGGTVSVPRRIGRQRSAYLVLTGASVSASTALEWGLVDARSD
jgi:enoyl-CoA hydratase/carnithine racemase